MDAGAFAELGLSPDADEAALRRAYVARLRAIDADRDPAAFMRLREAYERALASLARPIVLRGALILERAEPDEPAGRDVGPKREEDASRHDWPDIKKAFDAAIASHDTEGALALFNTAMASGVAPLGVEGPLAEAIVRSAITDTGLADDRFRDIVVRLGIKGRDWSRGERLKLARECEARFAAADWLKGLRAEASGWAIGPKMQRVLSARILLGRRGAHYWLPPAEAPPLKRVIEQYRVHARFLGTQIDPARIASIEKWFAGAPRRRAIQSRLEWTFLAIVVLVIVLSLLYPGAKL